MTKRLKKILTRMKKIADKDLRDEGGEFFSDIPDPMSGTLRDDGSILIDLTEPVERRAVIAVELPDGLPENIREAELDDLPDDLPLSFSSEAPVMRWGMPEILSHEKGDADFSRLAEVGAILKNHNPDTIVGSPVKVWRDTKELKGRLKMRFGTTAQAKLAKREVLIDKSLRGVSVGYTVAQYVFLRDADVVYKGRIKGPAYVATKWQALEASLTPIAADPTVGVKRHKPDQPKITKPKRETDMNFTAWLAARDLDISKLSETEQAQYRAEYDAEVAKEKQKLADAQRSNTVPALKLATPAPAPTQTVDEAKVRAEAEKAERSRVGEIMALCTSHGIEATVRDGFVSEGITVVEAQKKILDTLADKNRSMGTSVEVTKDGRAKFGQAAIEALDIRCGLVKSRDAKFGGDTVAVYSLVDLARDCLNRAGLPIPTNTQDLIRTALAGPEIFQSDIDKFARGSDIISGTTSDFPYILAAAANKSMLAGYGAVNTSYEEWCKIGSLSDFKATNRVKLSEAGDLQRIYESGKYQETAFSEDQNPIQVFTYGVKFNISRQAIINDDMSAFTTIPQRLGRSAARVPNVLAVVELLANAAMNDGIALFATGHYNYSAVAAYALDTLAHGQNGIKNLRKMLNEQRGMLHAKAAAASKTLYMGLKTEIILVATEDQAYIAQQIVGSPTDPTQNNSAVKNPLQNAGRVVQEILLSDSQITGYSSSGYYGVASPADAPVVEVAFLNGQREPFMEEVDQTDADGRVYKVRLDCGAAAVDYAGMVTERGA